MIELPETAFNKAAPVFAPFPHNGATVSSALTGRQPARIFVDAAEQPQAAVLFHYNSHVLLAGDEGNEDLWQFIGQIAPQQIFPKDRLILIPSSDGWASRLQAWGSGFLRKDPRLFINYPSEPSPEIRAWRRKLPDGADVTAIAADMLGPEAPHLLPRIGDFWDSNEAFDRYGLGFYLTVKTGQIVSVCYAAMAGPDSAAIMIHTEGGYDPPSPGVESEFLRKGYATAVASAFIVECLQRGIHPYWECTAGNQASANLACKLGFQEAGSFTRFWLT